jgi:RNA polymerase sigma factor (sigma-70 family)
VTDQERHVHVDSLDERELLRRCRSGDRGAFEVLFTRHRAGGLRMAIATARSVDPDDVVAEAFARVWSSLRSGGGPEQAFGPYLRTTVRNVAITMATRSREDATDSDRLEYGLTRSTQPDGDGFSSMIAEHEVVAKAFNSLPERWRSVLWAVEVEGRRASELSQDLGVSANSVSALTMRARDALSEAWLQQHVDRHDTGPECRWVLDHAGSFVRHALSARQKERIDHHLDACDDCSRATHRLAHLALSLRIVALAGGGSAAGIAMWSVSATPRAAAATLPGTPGPRSRTGLRGSRPARVAAGAAAAGVALTVVVGAALAASAGGSASASLLDQRPAATRNLDERTAAGTTTRSPITASASPTADRPAPSAFTPEPTSERTTTQDSSARGRTATPAAAPVAPRPQPTVTRTGEPTAAPTQAPVVTPTPESTLTLAPEPAETPTDPAPGPTPSASAAPAPGDPAGPPSIPPTESGTPDPAPTCDRRWWCWTQRGPAPALPR